MKVLLATIPSDSHTWNLVYMQLFLEELGHEVMNLGACVPIELLNATACQYQPDIIVISTINGHGNIEGVDIGYAIRANASLQHSYLVIGGKLGTQGEQTANYADKLNQAGFDEVFSGGQAMQHFAAFMHGLNEMLKPRLCAIG